MAASTTSAAQLTEQQVQAILVKPLEQASVSPSAGPRTFDVTAAGSVRIPKLVSMTAPTWHAENELSDLITVQSITGKTTDLWAALARSAASSACAAATWL